MIKKAIRKYCTWCSNYQPKEIRLCPASNCSLHSLRNGRNPNDIKRLKAIANRCADCVGGSQKQANKCEDNKCPLHSYRNGKNPARKGIGNKDIRKYLCHEKQIVE